LFVAFVLLGFAAVEVEKVGGLGQLGQVFLDFETQALEGPELFKEIDFKAKDSFFGWHGQLFFGVTVWNEHYRV
jgi:hypothetical protein